MKKILYSIVILFIASISIANASHFAGATFKVVNLGGSSYEVSFIFYRDCSGIPAPNTANINFTNANNAAMNFMSTFTISSQNSNIIQTCQSMPNNCNGGQSYGIEQDIYTNIVTLPPGDWTIAYNSCCRNPNNTMAQPTSESFYAEMKLNNQLAPNNHIPVFKQHPRFVSYINLAEEFNYSVTDFDGDSIAYKMAPALSGAGTPVTYGMGNSYMQPLPSSPPVALNSSTGKMNFTAIQSFIAVIVVEVEEWRNVNGTMSMISKNMVDHEVFFVTGNNYAPVIGGIDTTLTNGYSVNDTTTSAIVIAGDPFNMAVWGHDADPSTSSSPNGGTFSMGWDTAIAAATFVPHYNDSDSAFANFSWTPSMQDTGSVMCFSAFIADSACPYIGFNTFNYCFLVKDSGAVVLVASANGAPTNTICNHESIELRAPDGYDRYFWSNNKTTQTISLDSTELNIGANHFTCLLRVDNFEYLADITIFMDDCTGIEDYEKSVIQVYPNPASDMLNIEAENFENNFMIEVIDLQGKVLLNESNLNDKTQQLDISKLSKGVYLIKVSDHNKEIYQRFIKQ